MLEKNLQKTIKTNLVKQGWLVFKTVAESQAGFPDLTAIKDGKTIFIEVKTPTGKLSAIQRKVIGSMREHGAEVFVVTSFKELIDSMVPNVT